MINPFPALLKALADQRDKQQDLVYSTGTRIADTRRDLHDAEHTRAVAAGLSTLYTEQLVELAPEAGYALPPAEAAGNLRILTLAAWRQAIQFLEDNPDIPLPSPYKTLSARLDDHDAEAGLAALQAADKAGMTPQGYGRWHFAKTFGDHVVTIEVRGKSYWVPDEEDATSRAEAAQEAYADSLDATES